MFDDIRSRILSAAPDRLRTGCHLQGNEFDITMKPDFEIPLIYLGADGTDRDRTVHEGGALEDIALTLLEPVGLEKPAVMTGRSLPE